MECVSINTTATEVSSAPTWNINPSKTFCNLKEAEAYLKVEKVYGYRYESSNGYIKYYMCKSVKKREKIQCASRVKLVLSMDSEIVDLYQTIEDHNHDQLESKPAGLPMQTKLLVDQMIGDLATMKAIKNKIQLCDYPRTNWTQVENYVARVRAKIDGPSMLRYIDVEEWCNSRSEIPTKDLIIESDNTTQTIKSGDVAFVLKYEVIEPTITEKGGIRVVMTTKKFLKNIDNARLLCSDATYKVTSLGYPLLVVGTTNNSRRFQPIALALCTTEKQDDFVFVYAALVEAARIHGYNIQNIGYVHIQDCTSLNL